jgi:hypothetical protein
VDSHADFLAPSYLCDGQSVPEDIEAMLDSRFVLLIQVDKLAANATISYSCDASLYRERLMVSGKFHKQE